MISWVYIFMMYLLLSLSYMDKQSERNARKFEPHGNYQPYSITIHCWGHTEWSERVVSLNDVAITFETTSMAAAGKVKTCYYLLQVSSIQVSTSLIDASQSFANE